MPNQCKALNCPTYIGDSQIFCRKHWDQIPESIQKQIRRATEARQREEDVAEESFHRTINEAIDSIANRERQARLKLAVKPAV